MYNCQKIHRSSKNYNLDMEPFFLFKLVHMIVLNVNKSQLKSSDLKVKTHKIDYMLKLLIH